MLANNLTSDEKWSQFASEVARYMTSNLRGVNEMSLELLHFVQEISDNETIK